jgi:hypothetical protein
LRGRLAALPRGLALLAVSGLVLALVSVAYVSTRSPAPAPKPKSKPAPPNPTGLTPVEFDLTTMSAEPVHVSVPPRTRFTLVLKNRVSAASYTWRFDAPTLTTAEMPVPPVPSGMYSLGTPCPVLDEAWKSVLQALDEETVAARQAELESAARGVTGHECENAREVLKLVQPRGSAAQIGSGLALPPGGQASVVIERRDPATASVLRRWELRLVAAGRETGWAFADEETWIRSEVVADLVALLGTASTEDAQAVGAKVLRTADGWRAEATLPAGRLDAMLSAAEYAWSPAAYGSVVNALLALRPAAGSPPPSAPDPGLEQRLAAAENIAPLLAESERLATALSTAPLDAALHEQAALLIAAFAEQERAGRYSDVRRELSALAAHLAIAEVMRAGARPSRAGLLAEVALEALAGRERPALARLTSREAAGLDSAWKRALSLRLSGDWRGGAARPVAIEKRARVAAVAQNLNDLEGLARLEKETDVGVGLLRALVTVEPSVAAGNLLRESLLSAEVAEAAASLALGADVAADPKAFAKALVDVPMARYSPGGAERPLVRGWLARRAERHLANAVAIAAYSLWNQGNNQGLLEFRKSLAPLAPLPLVRHALQAALARSRQGAAASPAVAKEESDACAAIADAVQRQPERVPAAVWMSLAKDCAGAAGAGRVPLWDAWFGPLPQGTAYEAEVRIADGAVGRRLTTEAVEALRGLRPTSTLLFELSIERRHGRRPTAAEYREEMGPLFAYSVPALSAWAKLERERDGHEARAEALRRLCALQADECVWYGRFLAARSRDDQARAAFERARSSARDRVVFAAYSGWLAHHYLDRGDRARALALAQESAATYATGALAALGEIQERLGDQAAAVDAFQAIAEQYGSTNDIDCHRVRRVRRGAASDADAETALRRLFPRGIAHALVEELENEARKPGAGTRLAGRRVDEQVDPLVLLGVQVGDRILAVNGIRVMDRAQYACALTFDDEREVGLAVLRDGHVIELKGPMARTRFTPAGGRR